MTPPTTRTDRQILALRRQAKKYPSAKKKIKEIKAKQSHFNWLAQ